MSLAIGLGCCLFAQAATCVAQSAAQELGESNTAELQLTVRHSLGMHPAPDLLTERASRVVDIRAAVPQPGYTYTAYDAPLKAVGAQGSGAALFASNQNAILGGGATVWGAPIERLTLIGDAQRTLWGNFSPSFGALVHLLGKRSEGWSFGALGKFKIDGFAGRQSKDEVEGELEIGALVSLSSARWHLDINAIGGRGLGDDGESDVEGRLRFGRDLGQITRLGMDGQFRARVAGPRYLPNGQSYDFSVGPQLFIGSAGLYGALTAGPSTSGLTGMGFGFSSILSVGGRT